MAELEQHGGKIAMANKVIIPTMEALKFPQLEVNYSNDRCFKLPITNFGSDSESMKADASKATLMCLSFRATSQVSFIESWLLSLYPIKKLLLRMLKKPKRNESDGLLRRQIAYAFGDHYYFRKELKILNLSTGYIFLVDIFGRISWQGFGLASEDELSSLLSCTSMLLKEE